MTRRRALVVCPGRGTYNRDELGTLARLHGGAGFLAMADEHRRSQGQPTLTELDGAAGFDPKVHTRGDNASPLIHAASYLDFLAIDRDAFDIVGVTGNSMGWYIALACAGAVGPQAGLEIVNTMGTLMHAHLIGGQTIYPYVDAEWQAVPGRRAELLALAAEHGAALSIDLGGMLVLAGDAAALGALEAALPPLQGRYPLRLPNHAAFHTALQAPVAAQGRERLGIGLFGSPAIPLIDGRGAIWRPRETRPADLRAYTLGTQVVEPYDFARAIRTGCREFAPDAIIVTGPGTTLGGSVAQTLIATRWQGMASKADFLARQAADPFVLSMGLAAQRTAATGS